MKSGLPLEDEIGRISLSENNGGMAEWLKAAVLKIASRAIVTGVRIPLPPF